MQSQRDDFAKQDGAMACPIAVPEILPSGTVGKSHDVALEAWEDALRKTPLESMFAIFEGSKNLESRFAIFEGNKNKNYMHYWGGVREVVRGEREGSMIIVSEYKYFKYEYSNFEPRCSLPQSTSTHTAIHWMWLLKFKASEYQYSRGYSYWMWLQEFWILKFKLSDVAVEIKI